MKYLRLVKDFVRFLSCNVICCDEPLSGGQNCFVLCSGPSVAGCGAPVRLAAGIGVAWPATGWAQLSTHLLKTT